LWCLRDACVVPVWGLCVGPVSDACVWDLCGACECRYAPLSVRLVQLAMKPGWAAIADVMRQIPGPTDEVCVFEGLGSTM
jgi:hypothetical protein